MVQEIKQFFLILSLVLPLLSGCAGSLGTETGNPGGPSFVPTETGNPGLSPCPAIRVDASLQANTTTAEDEEIETELDTLIEYVCLRIFICDNEIHTLDCIEALNGIDGDAMLSEFGLNEDLWTVNEVHAALSSQSLGIDSSAIADCKDDILSIDCEDVTLNVDVDDFVDVENIIPLSCEGVFDDNPDPGASPDGDVSDPCL